MLIINCKIYKRKDICFGNIELTELLTFSDKAKETLEVILFN